MLEAFHSTGYQVDVVEGTTAERRKLIRSIRKNLLEGTCYDFCYSESSVGPTTITGGYRETLRQGSPDLAFLSFLKRKGIPVGLFYRDIYWQLDGYTYDKTAFKALLFRILYRWDLYRYRKSLKVMFLPSMTMGKYIGSTPYQKMPLPSGCVTNAGDSETARRSGRKITAIYVGGIGRHYGLNKLLRMAAEHIDSIDLILCVREREWSEYLSSGITEIPENIQVIHESGDGLKDLYAGADVGLLYLEPEEFRDFAMPYKLFEYLENGLPVLASSGTEVGRFVEDHDIGWTVPYEEKAFAQWLASQGGDFPEKAASVYEFRQKNTWRERAGTVACSLVTGEKTQS